MSTARFLTDYVGKHFGDEEQLQMRSKYPDYPAHKQFHDGYKRTIAQAAQELANEGPTLTALNQAQPSGQHIDHPHPPGR